MEIYQLNIALMDVRPPIWRRVQVLDSTNLGQLHQVLQVVMGWGDKHLHRFAIDRRGLEERYESFDAQTHAEHEITLRRIVAVQHTTLFYYEYDFGDGWVHELKVEKTFPPQTGMDYPICISGARRCPPEDCGGAAGYLELLETLRDPQHPGHARTLKWIGKRFDPEAFDLEKVNQDLRYLRTRL
jgi:hypothetical protein